MNDLHANNSVDEEDKDDEESNPGKRLERLDEGPEEGSNPLALGQELDQPHHAEQTEEADRDHFVTRLKIVRLENY